MALKVGDYKTDVHNDWCPGCGDFGIVNSIQMALAEMEIPRHETAIFSGIGCSGKTSHFINVFGVDGFLFLFNKHCSVVNKVPSPST